MKNVYLSIIIPAYNEAKRLPLTLIDIDKKVREMDLESYETINMTFMEDIKSEIRKLAGEKEKTGRRSDRKSFITIVFNFLAASSVIHNP